MMERRFLLILSFVFMLLNAAAPGILADAPEVDAGEEASETEVFEESFDDFSFEEEDSGFVGKEKFSLYGYLANFFQGSFVYKNQAFEAPSYGNTLFLRLKGDCDPEANLQFHAEAAYYGRVGNQNPSAYVHEALIDHAWGLANLGIFDLQFGKLPIAWGTGYVFNPTAKVATVSYLGAVSEETPGTIGIVPSLYIGDLLSISGYVAFQDKSHKTSSLEGDGKWNNLPFGIKLQAITGPFDISAGFIKEVLYNLSFQREYYLSADLDGAVWDLGLYAEAALQLPQAPKDYNIEESLEVAAGCYYTIPFVESELRLEYYHQGRGESDRSSYDVSRVLAQEQLVLAEDYLFVYLERTFQDIFKLGAGSLINLNDGSFVLYPDLAYDVYNNFQLSLGAYFFFGGKGSEFNGEHTVNGSEMDLTETFSVYARCKISF